MRRLIVRGVVFAVSPFTAFVLIFLFVPGWLVGPIAQHSPNVLYHVPTSQKVVALSIDDGPNQQTTEKLLDLLAQYRSEATFFLLSDNIPGNEPLVREMVVRGHEIGNHLTADEASISLSDSEFEKKLIHADKILTQFGQPVWFRPGSGLYDKEMLNIVMENEYRCALGSVHPLDPQLPSARFAAWYVLQNVEPGAIIILHDGGERGQRIVEVLKNVLPQLANRGYEVVTISDLVRRSP